ncbi:hypothetical protein MMPV_004464 [Pyropia vietnamensis]
MFTLPPPPLSSRPAPIRLVAEGGKHLLVRGGIVPPGAVASLVKCGPPAAAAASTDTAGHAVAAVSTTTAATTITSTTAATAVAGSPDGATAALAAPAVPPPIDDGDPPLSAALCFANMVTRPLLRGASPPVVSVRPPPGWLAAVAAAVAPDRPSWRVSTGWAIDLSAVTVGVSRDLMAAFNGGGAGGGAGGVVVEVKPKRALGCRSRLLPVGAGIGVRSQPPAAAVVGGGKKPPDASSGVLLCSREQAEVAAALEGVWRRGDRRVQVWAQRALVPPPPSVPAATDTTEGGEGAATAPPSRLTSTSTPTPTPEGPLDAVFAAAAAALVAETLTRDAVVGLQDADALGALGAEAVVARLCAEGGDLAAAVWAAYLGAPAADATAAAAAAWGTGGGSPDVGALGVDHGGDAPTVQARSPLLIDPHLDALEDLVAWPTAAAATAAVRAWRAAGDAGVAAEAAAAAAARDALDRLPVADAAGLLARFMVAQVANDCSFMIALRQEGKGTIGGGRGGDGGDGGDTPDRQNYGNTNGDDADGAGAGNSGIKDADDRPATAAEAAWLAAALPPSRCDGSLPPTPLSKVARWARRLRHLAAAAAEAEAAAATGTGKVAAAAAGATGDRQGGGRA